MNNLSRRKSIDMWLWWCLVLAPLALALLMLACDEEERASGDWTPALQAMKTGEIVRLTDIVKEPANAVCVLTPYENVISEKNELARRANTHLMSSKYEADEGHWAIVVISDEAVRVHRFKRSRHLDLDLGYEGSPFGFKPARCASMGRGAILKFDRKDRPTVVLGEIQ
jgi:hypothetical protein